jgi:hypothetical protein
MVEALVTQNSFPSGSRITVQVSGLSGEAESSRTSTKLGTRSGRPHDLVFHRP